MAGMTMEAILSSQHWDWREQPTLLVRQSFEGLAWLRARRELAVAIARCRAPDEAIEEVKRVAAELLLDERHQRAVAHVLAALGDAQAEIERRASK